MENVVRIEELPEVVEKTLLGIRDGLAAARKHGLHVELPDYVDFQVVVIDKWQALTMEGGQTTVSVEEQGGGTTETSTGVENSEQTRTSEETRDTTENSEQTSERKSEEDRVTSQVESGKTLEGGSSTTTGSRESTGTSSQENAHNQQQSTTYTYDG